jgi:hypothetical protein
MGWATFAAIMLMMGGVWGVIGGIILFLSGLGIFSGNVLARTVGVIVAGLSAIVNFAWMPYYPVRAIVAIAVDIASSGRSPHTVGTSHHERRVPTRVVSGLDRPGTSPLLERHELDPVGQPQRRHRQHRHRSVAGRGSACSRDPGLAPRGAVAGRAQQRRLVERILDGDLHRHRDRRAGRRPDLLPS